MKLWEHFDKNEIYLITILVVLYATFFLLPKKLPRSITLLTLMWGFASSTFFDFTIGGGKLDFYKVNDSNEYELTDLMTYFLFAPFSYFFIYFYERLNINKKTVLWYILGWSIIGIIAESVSKWMGVTYYQHGYQPTYSVAVFLIIQTTSALYYELIKSRQSEQRV